MALNTNNAPIYMTRNVTSIHGGRLGLSINNELVGPVGLARKVNTDLTSTTPTTNVQAHGVIVAGCSGSSQGPTQHTLDYPMQGVDLTILLNSTSTGSHQFSAPSGASIIWSSLGTTVAQVNMTGQGGHVTLMGISTSQWVVTSQQQCTNSTST